MMKDKINFYLVKQDFSNSYFPSPVVIENKGKIQECPRCGAIHKTNLEDLRIYTKSEKIGEYYSIENRKLIGIKLQNMLKNNEITGYLLRNVNVQVDYNLNAIKKAKCNISELKEIEILGRCGYLRHIDGSIIENCSECGSVSYKKKREVNGLSIRIDEWDKSDIFYFKNWVRGGLIVTERVKDLVENYGLAINFRFIHISEYRFS